MELTGAHGGATPFSPIASLHLFVSLLGEVEHATPEAPGAFYNRLAEAVCRLGSMRRAVVFVYDDVARRVRVVGSHEVDIELFDGHILAIETAPIAGRALDLDQVLEGSADELAAPYDTLLGLEHLVCVPLAAGGRGFGVIIAEGTQRSLSEEEREALRSLGKVCALALSARLATRQQSDARHLADRIDLAREIHERVVQRVFGVVMALQSGALLDEADQRRAAAELGHALDDLRDAMGRPLAATTRLVTSTLRDELVRLQGNAPDGAIEVAWQDGLSIPTAFEPVTQSVLGEAIRNARRHATPGHIAVAVRGDADTVELEITNDGVSAAQRGGAGMGLRIAAFEALQHGASLTFGPTGPEHWHVRLVLPRPEPA
ncbi:MAG TPA: GAF domain-containing protein [Baekduia sp.]|uniref:GAF domain-containing sensor histidine kinase n=1 Tax=Baekduia sp. TaxID=2600305 RepID=UPI002BE4E02C|nr:GAF domain-containing protein [Baekduia sp.]HMJ36535.1 GAF domain-containing protein [Baekduia sp.]